MKNNVTLDTMVDSTLRDHIAWFVWDDSQRRYLIEVCGMIVARLHHITDVREFCDMHNGRLA